MKPIDHSKTAPLLKLARSHTYSFYGSDSEAEACIRALASAMRLQGGLAGRKVVVYTVSGEEDERRFFIPADESEPILCEIEKADNQDLFYVQVERIARAVAGDIIRKGGALVHGGLCSLNGCGAIMAGQGSIGKSTASERLPAPWISHCDDSTLVISLGKSCFAAHPWPTWSRFYWGGDGGSWAVENRVPLSTIFFLGQAEKDSLEAVNPAGARSMLIDTIEHVTRPGRWKDLEKQDFLLRCAENAAVIAAAVPAYRLKVSLTGQFWERMARVMPACNSGAAAPLHDDKNVTMGIADQFPMRGQDGECQYLIYRGSSMHPTFIEPELLTVKPYNEAVPGVGDIICYRLNNHQDCIVHRVIAGGGSGKIRTRGDNSNSADRYTVELAQVAGKVVSARRNNHSRQVHGGIRGIIDMHLSRGSRKTNRMLRKLLKNSYLFLSGAGIFRIWAPGALKYRIAVFQKHTSVYPKIILKGKTVGTYDFRSGCWKIKRPYRLLIDEKTLPDFEKPVYNLLKSKGT